MKVLLQSCAVCLLCASVAFPQVTLLGSLRPDHGSTGGVSFAGCWGYTAPNGREYAIVGTATGCSFIDITNAATPIEIGHIPGATSLWKEVKAYDHYAYVVSDVSGNQGLQIINLANLPSSVSLDTTIMSLGGFSVAQSHTISIHDGYLYLNGTANGMIIASLANPRRPQYLGRWATRYVHDSYVRNDTIFAAAINQGRLDIINGANKASPSLIASIAYTGGGTHNVWTTKDRKYAITTDEIGSTAKNLKVWDLQNLPTVSTTPVATFSPNPADIVHNVFVRGNYAYVAWYTAGLRVVNFSNPTIPADAGGFDTSTEPPGSYDGMWACYPYFPSGKIIGSDMQNGLYIFGFAGLAARRNTALLEPANGENISSGPIRFRWSHSADPDKDPHYYVVHLSGAGFDTTYRTTDSTLQLADVSRLTQGETYTWNVTTKDEFNGTPSAQSFTFTFANPVVLESFTATFEGNGRVRLNWRTLSEFQNLGFEVQRGRHSNLLETLPGGFVAGSGTTTVPHDYVYTDTAVAPNVWYYRLKQNSQSGSSKLFEPESVQVVTGVSEGTPESYSLSQNYPNPFNPTATIKFSVGTYDHTSLRVFDVLGREVATLVNEELRAGSYTIEFNAGSSAHPLTSGVYFYELTSGSFKATKKMILAK